VPSLAYLIFNEGYASTAGTALIRVDLAQEAIRLTRTLYAARPGDSEVAALLALMLLIHARHRARTAPDGSLVSMAEQDRSLWDRGAIDEGVALVTAALPRGPVGPYQLQAAIAASTMRRRTPKRPTGARSPPSTAPCSAWTTTRSSRSTTPSPSAWPPGPGPASN
jgi:predicted RNA polymerase sigma factor